MGGESSLVKADTFIPDCMLTDWLLVGENRRVQSSIFMELLAQKSPTEMMNYFVLCVRECVASFVVTPCLPAKQHNICFSAILRSIFFSEKLRPS